MTDRIAFEGWVKTIVANLYDFTILETHPLSSELVKVPTGFSGSRGEIVRRLFLDAIDQLRPIEKEPNPNLPKWRPYIILTERYVNDKPLHEVAAQLSISDRQLRRDQHRALMALASCLWETLNIARESGPTGETSGEGPVNPFQYAIHREIIRLPDVIQAVMEILQKRIQETGGKVDTNFDKEMAPVFTDRVILRQVLISLLTAAIQAAGANTIILDLAETGPEVTLTIQIPQTNPKSSPLFENETRETLKEWAERTGARLEIGSLSRGSLPHYRVFLALPRADRKTILVVDDQESAIQLFQRFLHRSNIMVVGETQPDQVVRVVTRLQPAAIILDVMMPQMDGWEVLQALRVTEETSAIPVLICSAWIEPELARSLGAAGFLKKPLTQKMLLNALTELNLLD